METSESPTPETADRRPLGQRMQSLRRGLALLKRTRSRDDRRVMLGYVFKDLEALRGEAILVDPRFSASFAALETEALAWRAEIGAPVAADEDPATRPTRRKRKKENPHGSPGRRPQNPDPHDGTPAAPAVAQE